MNEKKRKPNHPGKILEDFYIIPLNLNLQELADRLRLSRNSLFKLRHGLSNITPSLAIRLGEAFGTTPNLWLNREKHRMGRKDRQTHQLNFAFDSSLS